MRFILDGPLTLGALLLIGLLADEGSRRLGLPSVTILLVLGFVVGPDALDVLPATAENWFPTVSTIALTMVARFHQSRLRIVFWKAHSGAVLSAKR